MIKKIFFDESGFTGNFRIKNKKFNTNDNDIFILVGIEDDENNNFIEDIKALKSKLRIQAQELKSKQILKRYDKFLPELLTIIKEKEINVFIEVIDKYFFLSMQLTEFLIYSPLMKNKNSEVNNPNARKTYSLFFYNFLSVEIFEDYYNLIHEPTEKMFTDFLKTLINIFENLFYECIIGSYYNKNYLLTFNQIVASIMDLLKNVLETYLEIEDYNKENSVSNMICSNFLPIGDYSYKENYYNSYYHLSCFVNIVKRIDEINKNSEIFLIHDNQLESKNILEKNLDEMKQGKYNTLLNNSHSLFFKDSKDDILIQIADVLAGGLRKTIENKLKLKNTDLSIKNLKEFNKACQINFVLPLETANKLDVILFDKEIKELFKEIKKRREKVSL